MTDLEDRLRRLSMRGETEPQPLDELARRAGRLRRRRRVAQGTAAITAVALVGVLGVTLPQLTLRSRTGPDVVFDQPPAPLPDGWTRTSIGPLALDHPEGWKVRRVVDEDSGEPRVVLSNRPLSDQDLDLALLARPDVRFSADFPRDAVVFVVGGDPQDREPAPASDLGERRVLPRPEGFDGDIVARLGRVPESVLQLAAYIGPDVRSDAGADAEVVAQRLRLATSPGSVTAEATPEPPPPPSSGPGGLLWSGNDPDNPVFTEPWPVAAQIPLEGDEVVNVRVKDGCAAVTQENLVEQRNLSVLLQQCDLQDIDGAIEVVADSYLPLGSPHMSDGGTHLVVARVAAGVEDLDVRLAGGGRARTTVENGWALVRADGRVFHVVARGADGERLGAYTSN